jgi:hypothetical protein
VFNPRYADFNGGFHFLNTAKQCWNAEPSEAIERHKVPLEFLIAEGV